MLESEVADLSLSARCAASEIPASDGLLFLDVDLDVPELWRRRFVYAEGDIIEMARRPQPVHRLIHGEQAERRSADKFRVPADDPVKGPGVAPDLDLVDKEMLPLIDLEDDGHVIIPGIEEPDVDLGNAVGAFLVDSHKSSPQLFDRRAGIEGSGLEGEGLQEQGIAEDLVPLQANFLEPVAGAFPDLQRDRDVSEGGVDGDVIEAELHVEVASRAIVASQLVERAVELVGDKIAPVHGAEETLGAQPADLDDLITGQLRVSDDEHIPYARPEPLFDVEEELHSARSGSLQRRVHLDEEKAIFLVGLPEGFPGELEVFSFEGRAFLAREGVFQ